MDNKIKYNAFPHVNHQHMEVMLKCFSICSSRARMCIEECNTNIAILCSDCADICSLVIKLHSRDSEFTHQAEELLKQARISCATECSKMDSDHCQQCSEICKECIAAIP